MDKNKNYFKKVDVFRSGKRGKEPDVAEFISAIAAGNNAQLMMVSSAGVGG